MREIVFYRTRAGRSPVSEFVLSLDLNRRKKVSSVLRMVEAKDRVSPEHLKKLAGTDGLFEIRVTYVGDTFRLLGFFDGPLLIVLVSGFAKKSAKLPLAEIRTAQERRRDYLKRKAEHE